MSEEMNSVDLQKVAELLADEIEILNKYSISVIQPADLNHITTACERIGMESLKYIIRELGDTLKNIFITAVVKNPCRKCLVRACCTLLCEDKKYYLSFCDVDGNIKFQRICALSIIFTILILFLSILKIIGG